ncbi:hypothetical protein XA68_10082 [Ophiocordyceps unilateralis]|uniref:Tetrapyrrole biosynthesis uroporphyrinogen III synthase domain-containing protein n=1 Tax=Ophiocordyceps unilateralis TaxID=268505 RepID=A0A2A9PPX5_OPHUN|nr:hypothetical protein XA68_10082 [Ophiocordyceps unilateralis]
MAPPPESSATTAVPVLLLKTPSSPLDPYEEHLSGSEYAPQFVPVLCHRRSADAAARVEALLRRRQIGIDGGCAFGGLIFTSQRAVEAFAAVVEAGRAAEEVGPDWPYLRNVPVFAVGPATAQALEGVAPMRVMGGAECGNGEALARFILEQYHHRLDAAHRPPLLFLVGEQRRDVIPRMLMDAALPPAERIDVTEEVVYATTVVPSLAQDLDLALRRSADASVRWLVVFSPSGCDSLLRSLGWLDAASGETSSGRTRDGKTLIATIGPTTRAHLVDTFGFEPDVCAATPSPEGLRQGIEHHMRQLSRTR